MKFLVTGGAGFIGSHITDALVKNGDKVVVLDDFSSGRRENLETVLDKIELVEGDIRDKAIVSKVMRGVDYCLHQAALRSVPKSLGDPGLYNDVNINGTLNILNAAKEAKVKRVVFASSSSIYGETDKLPEKEDFLPLLISPYALTKLAGEYYCRIFSQIYGLETASLRYFNVFGPRQSLENEYAVVIPKFITCMLKDEEPPVHGDGKQTRDFTYIANVVQANIKAATTPGIKCEVFNIACGKAYSVLDIVKYVNKILKKDIKPRLGPIRPGDVKYTLADITKAKKLLKFNPDIGFEEGLKKAIEYFSKNVIPA
ncbi:MAG: SDR family oxidoreductase [Candidatus Omnitrophica bacterium]|nr:SDR family oxidoreductase [Candidatus Omnitrophota bacterium]